jgi:chemotaxis protein MotB
MTGTAQDQTPPPTPNDWPTELAEFTAAIPGGRYPTRALKIERRFPGSVATPAEEPTFSSPMPRPSHWSIAWSDLMMTMFVLFLSMFVYQAARQEFLAKPRPEIIGGDTTEALQSQESSAAVFPFAPIAPGLPLMTAGTVKKVERVEIPPAADLITPEEPSPPSATPAPPELAEGLAADGKIPAERVAILVETPQDGPPPLQADLLPAPDAEVSHPRPLIAEEAPRPGGEPFQEMFALGRDALENNKLDKFAAIELVPDKTMRIILTSDLLFALGESTLSAAAQESLKKIAGVIRHTPYMINVVGHTDNIPMRSSRFDSNWELSVARASTVTRFLIDQTEMDPNQFVVSGYASYRPLFPNTTAENRARNRRVEIIISQRLPQPIAATDANLNN